jgi:hypothetical protein
LTTRMTWKNERWRPMKFAKAQSASLGTVVLA